MSSLEEVLPKLSLSEFKEFSRRHYGEEKFCDNIIQDVTISLPIIKFDEKNVLRGALPSKSLDNDDSKITLHTSYAAIVKKPNNRTVEDQQKIKKNPSTKVVLNKKVSKPKIILKGNNNGLVTPKSANAHANANGGKRKQRRKKSQISPLKSHAESSVGIQHTNYFQALVPCLSYSSEDDSDCVEQSDCMEEANQGIIKQ